jgi:hypothetical protein
MSFGGSTEDAASGGIQRDGVASGQDLLRIKELQMGKESGALLAELFKDPTGGDGEAVLQALQLVASSHKEAGGADAREAFMLDLTGLLQLTKIMADAAGQGELEFVHLLAGGVESAAGVGGLKASAKLVEMPVFEGQTTADKIGELRGNVREPPCGGMGVLGEDFGGGAGGGGAKIRHKIADGEVYFMANGGNHGQRGMKDGAGDDFFVEGPKVFQAAAATGEENGVKRCGGLSGPLVEQSNSAGDIGGGTGTLDGAGHENDFNVGIAALHDMNHIADGGAGRGGDKTDALGETGQGTFSFGGEEAFGVELLFEFFEGGLEGADALEFDGLNLNLVLAARLIDCDRALENDFAAIGQGVAMGDGIAAEKDATELGSGVFEGEIDVTGGLLAEVGDFAGNPDLANLLVEGATDVGGQFGDGEDAAEGVRGEEFAAEIPG